MFSLQRSKDYVRRIEDDGDSDDGDVAEPSGKSLDDASKVIIFLNISCNYIRGRIQKSYLCPFHLSSIFFSSMIYA